MVRLVYSIMMIFDVRLLTRRSSTPRAVVVPKSVLLRPRRIPRPTRSSAVVRSWPETSSKYSLCGFRFNKFFNIHRPIRKVLKLATWTTNQPTDRPAGQASNCRIYTRTPCDFYFILVWSRSSRSNKTTWSVDGWMDGRVARPSRMCAWNLLISCPDIPTPINSVKVSWRTLERS